MTKEELIKKLKAAYQKAGKPLTDDDLADMEDDSLDGLQAELEEVEALPPLDEKKNPITENVTAAQIEARTYLGNLWAKREITAQEFDALDTWVSDPQNARRLATVFLPGQDPTKAQDSIRGALDKETERVRKEGRLAFEQDIRDSNIAAEKAKRQRYDQAYNQQVLQPLIDMVRGFDDAGNPVVASDKMKAQAAEMLDKAMKPNFQSDTYTLFNAYLRRNADEIAKFAPGDEQRVYESTLAPLDFMRQSMPDIFQRAFPGIELEKKGITNIVTGLQSNIVPLQGIEQDIMNETVRLDKLFTDNIARLDSESMGLDTDPERARISGELRRGLQKAREDAGKQYGAALRRGEAALPLDFFNQAASPVLQGILGKTQIQTPAGDALGTLTNFFKTELPTEKAKREKEEGEKKAATDANAEVGKELDTRIAELEAIANDADVTDEKLKADALQEARRLRMTKDSLTKAYAERPDKAQGGLDFLKSNSDPYNDITKRKGELVTKGQAKQRTAYQGFLGSSLNLGDERRASVGETIGGFDLSQAFGTTSGGNAKSMTYEELQAMLSGDDDASNIFGQISKRGLLQPKPLYSEADAANAPFRGGEDTYKAVAPGQTLTSEETQQFIRDFGVSYGNAQANKASIEAQGRAAGAASQGAQQALLKKKKDEEEAAKISTARVRLR